MMRALQSWTEHNKDPKANVEVSYVDGDLTSPQVSLFYNGPTPLPGVFDILQEALHGYELETYKSRYTDMVSKSI
jgi:hypothetical protein